MRVCCLLCLLCLVSSLAMAESSPAPGGELSEIADAYLKNAIEEHQIPGVSAGIAVDGQIVWTGAAGVASVEKGTLVTPETPFRVASISKVLTATAILQLAEKGLIDLEASVQTYLPDYPPPREGTMSVLHLLSHTSGIRHSKGDESRRSLHHYGSMIEACRFFQDRKLAFRPGTKYKYSSYGYTVLGAIIEKVTHGSFEAYMGEHVWTPAGMLHTGLDKRPVLNSDAASLYRLARGRVVPDTENDLSVIYPGGGLVATAGDLLRFTVALENGALLSGTSIDRMLMHPADDEERGGLGWNVWEHEAHGRILSRVGGQSGASSLLVSYADRGVTVALLTNLARLDSIWTLTNDLIGMGLTTRAARARLIESE